MNAVAIVSLGLAATGVESTSLRFSWRLQKLRLEALGLRLNGS